jgi:hypothetical protein
MRSFRESWPKNKTNRIPAEGKIEFTLQEAAFPTGGPRIRLRLAKRGARAIICIET